MRAAIVNSGEQWPATRLSVALSPASLPKRGSTYDLAIAVAVLAASGAVPAPGGEDRVLFVSELGLDGRLRSVPGVLPAVTAAAAHGIGTVVVAAANAVEAGQVPGVRIVPACTLAEVAAWLRGGPEPPRGDPGPGADAGTGPAPWSRGGDFADVRGQDAARMAAEICAAGGHNMSLLGPPGRGAVMIAERLPTIMPGLSRDEALEVAAVHSVAGLLPAGGTVTRPPFRAPHHTTSTAAMIGGGSGVIRHGEATLAHRGVLLLENAPEFAGDALAALREPLAHGKVTIARAGMTVTFPAQFSLVLTACPCPCTAAGLPPGGCSCTPAARRRYLARLSGPLMDWIDLKTTMTPPGPEEHRAGGEPSGTVLGRVTAARERAARRLDGTAWRLNSQIPVSVLRRCFPLAPGASQPLDNAVSLGAISERAAGRAVRVAWTIADLACRDRPQRGDCGLALTYATGAGR